MQSSPKHWHPVLRSQDLRNKPVSRTRFEKSWAFWRDSNGKPILMLDQCPHRGAALSLGRVHGDAIACPFHGFRFASSGQCVLTPPEGDKPVPADLAAQVMPCIEQDGYIWMWTGPIDTERPDPPQHAVLRGLSYGESASLWPAHYTRCIENVCDFSHLPFVHRTTIGLFKSNYTTHVEVEALDGGFQAWLLADGKRSQCFEFIYPNLWLLRVQRSLLMSAVFVPVDENNTEVYGRSYVGNKVPGLNWLLDAYTRLSQYLVFREDWPIVASQNPGDVNAATSEKLLSSDAPVIAYRKLHRANTNHS